MASQTLTYMLWLFGGWLGLHHVYLGRCDQAWAYFVTFGGGFGLAWFRDIIRIPAYVKWSNVDKEFQKEHMDKITTSPTPTCGIFRSLGMAILGIILAFVFCGLLPSASEIYTESVPWFYFGYGCVTALLVIFGTTIGVYLVANIGELECSIWYPLGGSLASIPWLIYRPTSAIISAFLACGLTCYKGLRWRPLPPPPLSEEGRPLRPLGKRRRRGHCRNLTVYFFCTTLWLCLLAYGMYYNGKITINGGEQIPVREALNNFFKSEAWRKTKDSLYAVYVIYKHRGVWQAYEDLKSLLDIYGEANALKVIGLEKTATQQEITKRCRQLAKDNHPDRFKKEAEKKEAQQRFIESQDACSKLSNTKYKRAKKNSKPDDA
ncbi:Dnaj-like protein subfamily c member 22 [Plakobranchus ocellatus]|uniref:DnaJ homolog subfamily C member 22 n=1 Tax=Plakobranchus ocellatus TaxID=259542 RepID=A0AAV4BMX1_9GAST|nr:Dnaj-like protein subfamily c member 22 [Plakobranchus ocellatus]